jgi:thiamine-phosphate pyrophosphorylase
MAKFTLPRFYPILDTEVAARFEVEPVTAAAEILDVGAKILQFRHKGFFSRETVEDIERIAALCREAGATFVVNDRADIARVVGAAVHLGQEDLTPTLARHVAGDETIIGYSTHNEGQLRAAAGEPADYLALGPIFETASKRNPDPVVGLERLRLWRLLTPRPLVAIGGITRANTSRVLEAGADSVAVIGDLFPDVSQRANEWIKATGVG